jgi:hypothetical protein
LSGKPTYRDLGTALMTRLVTTFTLNDTPLALSVAREPASDRFQRRTHFAPPVSGFWYDAGVAAGQDSMDEQESDLRGHPRLRRYGTLGVRLWGSTTDDLRRQLLAPYPKIPSGWNLGDFRSCNESPSGFHSCLRPREQRGCLLSLGRGRLLLRTFSLALNALRRGKLVARYCVVRLSIWKTAEKG